MTVVVDDGMDTGMLVLIISLSVCCGLPCLLICFAAIYHTYIEEAAPLPIPAEYKDKRCELTCLCGETEIHFRNWMPRLREECMCYDCCQRWDWQRQ